MDSKHYDEESITDLSLNSVSQHQHEPNELGSMVTEFDKLQKLNRQLTDDATTIEKRFYTICQKFQAEKTEWKNEQIRMNNIERENVHLRKEVNRLTKQYQRVKCNHEKLLASNKQLESRVEEQETIIEHMRDIVFNDTSEVAGHRRAALHDLTQRSTMNQSSMMQSEQVTEELKHPVLSDAESSDLNQAYGEYFISSRGAARDNYPPIPSGKSPQLKSPIPSGKSPLSKSPMKLAKMAKKSKFENESFIVTDNVYNTPTKQQKGHKFKMVTASELIPTELVLYISALQDKLDHPDLYIKTPDTDELGTIESIKKRLRNGNFNESEEVMLRELGDESTTVLCQLVKDYFIDSGSALLVGGDEQFENMLQSVRCCNDPYLMTLIKSLPLAKQTQLAFLISHLQSAVEAGRSTGELACCFASVIVESGSTRNQNDPKELIQKMIELLPSFYRAIVTGEKSDEAAQTSSVGSMLGPGMDLTKTSEWKNLIKEKQKKLLQKLDSGKLFKMPTL